ncbi:hypothetical protein [Actinocorallia populi]|uniref:hypothetical protein n=1 Tax=Actinocorallia populi TaxID=2079200 RepID=UPI0018E4E1E8|nr:hypothetical protein [Actinocorallia populi]
MSEGIDFASASLPRHLARGAIGFGSIAGAFVLLSAVGPVGLLLLPVGLVALRGCPMCWTLGLVQTLSRGRLERDCVDGVCELRVAERDGDGGAVFASPVVGSVAAPVEWERVPV